MRLVKIACIFILASAILSCSEGGPSQLYFEGGTYELAGKNESKGGKFDIHEYSNSIDKIFLIMPHKETDLAAFAKLYTNTFKAQGFSFTSKGNEYIGKSKSNIVYLTVSDRLEALSILLVENSKDRPADHDSAFSIFQSLKELK